MVRPISEIFRNYGVLDAEGRHVNGTDKQTNHAYGDAYERILTERLFEPQGGEIVRIEGHYYNSTRRSVKLMMEVGIADGSSLLAWREVFPNALCVGMDVMPNPIYNLHDKSRVEFNVGDATRKEDCDRAAGDRQFDFIVEDATHQLEDSLRTLLYLWPYVRPGGLYVIEEFANIGALRANIAALWPFAEVVDTQGPFGGIEPLVVFRKPC